MAVLTDLTIAEAGKGLAAGDFTARELTDAYLSAMEAARGLNAYTEETPERARAMAGASDARRADGRAAGPLDGIPLAIKDLFCTEGALSTAGSHILDGFRPTYESTVTRQLWEAGAVMLGKANMDEFAMGSANITSHYGPCINPWKAAAGDNAGKDLVPGGSSGGSAAAVAARIAAGATGTDTGGSIRQPGAFCGIVGLKPTYGRCSRWGIIAFASSLDQAGPIARTVEDAALMLGAMAGYDPKDSTSVDTPVPDYAAALTGDIRGLRVGVPAEYRMDGTPAEIEALWQQGVDWLRDAGAEVVDISLPHTKYALPAYYIVAPAELRRRALRPQGRGCGSDRHLRTDPRGGLWRRGAAPGDDRHLCAVGRLLRCLLPEGAACAHAHRAGLQGGVGALRRYPDADHAQRGVCHRREDGRSHRHVPERHLHRARLDGRAAGDLGARGPVGRGAAAGAAPDRPGLRRGNRAARRRRDRDRRRLRRAAVR
jgi:Asp-tRNA(Asn)/Glu-tRNA(Gln) amidotransferase A subunit family amidase